MNDSGDKNWRIRVDNETLGPFSEVEMRHWLAEHRGKRAEVQQGRSDWYPSSVILQRFKELARTGIYLRVNGQVEGPYTRPRFVQRMEQLGNAEVDAKEGNDGFWVSAKVILRELNPNQLAPPPRTTPTAPKAPSGTTPRGTPPKTPNAPPRPAVPATPKTTDSVSEKTTTPVRANCPVCKATLQVPADQLGKTIRCASCKKQIRVVGKSNSAVTPTPTQSPVIDDDVVTLGDDDFAASVPTSPRPATSVFAPLENVTPIRPVAVPRPYTPPQPAPVPNPYASPGPQNPPYYAGAQHRSSLPHPALYIIPGVLIAMYSLVMIVLSCVGLVLQTLVIANLDRGAPGLVSTSLNILITLMWVIAHGITLVGAVHMILRRNLTFARISAIVASVPCIGFPFSCLIFPVGVISCVILFMNEAKRAFRS
ncbi:membrane protein [Rhodopirellula maiorica SM1]|uniref:Membrane protein n=1 Tax=Rhodopirellula maiorica SM1 TaxID=1265738 RepID=M5S4H5_9BACT|nr:membrane protein [Rhodopirellula maiorica]EMI22547.1 membrane protein [Rhodopirellula maiorica SM1]